MDRETCQALVHSAKPLALPSPQGFYPTNTACADPGRRVGLLGSCLLSWIESPRSFFIRQVLVPLAGPPGPGKFRRRPVSDPSHTCIPHEKDAEDRQSIGRQEGVGGVVYVPS